MRRVRMYIDGFNFYYSIHEGNKRGQIPMALGWCDFRRLGEKFMLRPGEVLERINYFTAPVTAEVARPKGEEHRQRRWLQAVGTIGGIRVIHGFHQKHDTKPRAEKLTDINIAVELLCDAVDRSCDRAVLVTGDIDQAPTVRAVRERLPADMRLEVDLWIPPGIRHRRWLAEAAELGMMCNQITPEMLAASRLDDVVVSPSGETIECLEEWRMPTGLAGLKWAIAGEGTRARGS